VERDVTEEEDRLAFTLPLYTGDDVEPRRMAEIDPVSSLEHNAVSRAGRNDACLSCADLRADFSHAQDVLAREIQHGLQHAPLVVPASAEAQVHQDAAAVREDGFVRGIGDGRAEGSVAEHPVADARDRVRATGTERDRVLGR